MRAIILAAGHGRRLAPLTDSTHKALMPIGRSTILGRLLDALEAANVRDIVIVTGYRADEIRAFVGEHHAHLGVIYVHNARHDETNNIHSAALAFNGTDPINDDVLLIECDLVFEQEVLATAIESPHPNVALVDRFRTGMDGTVLEIAPDGRVLQVIPSASQGPHFDFTDKWKTLNIYKFSRQFVNDHFRKLLGYYSSAIDDNCYYELILGLIVYARRADIWAVPVEPHSWAEVDDPNNLRAARIMMEPNGRRAELDRMWGGFWSLPVLDFAFIRNMHFPTDAVISELRRAMPELMQNYGSTQSILDEKMSYALQCRADRVICLNGASQAFPLLSEEFSGQPVTIPSPTFGEYDTWFPAASTFRDSGTPTDDRAIEALSMFATTSSMLVVVNPNNPTGTVWASHALHALADQHPLCTFVVDESFIEFSSEPSMMSCLERAPLENVVVIKSLSKTWGVPGLRIGAMYSCNLDLVAKMRARLPVWNCNSVAEHFVELVLKHRRDLEVSYRRTAIERDEFARQLARHPIIERVVPSAANFVLVRLRWQRVEAAAAADALCRDAFIYVKDVSAKFRDGAGYWRLAVRTPSDHERLFNALDELWRNRCAHSFVTTEGKELIRVQPR